MQLPHYVIWHWHDRSYYCRASSWGDSEVKIGTCIPQHQGRPLCTCVAPTLQSLVIQWPLTGSYPREIVSDKLLSESKSTCCNFTNRVWHCDLEVWVHFDIWLMVQEKLASEFQVILIIPVIGAWNPFHREWRIHWSFRSEVSPGFKLISSDNEPRFVTEIEVFFVEHRQHKSSVSKFD